MAENDGTVIRRDAGLIREKTIVRCKIVISVCIEEDERKLAEKRGSGRKQ